MEFAILLIILAVVAGGGALAVSTAAVPPATSGEPESPVPSGVPSSVRGVWRKYDAIFQYWGSQYGIPWEWLKAVCLNESLLGENAACRVARTDDGVGIMQIVYPTTGSELAGYALSAEDLIGNDDYSIELAAKYLYRLSLQFGGDQRKVIMSYNQGPGNTMKGAEYAAGYYDRFLRNLELVTTYA